MDSRRVFISHAHADNDVCDRYVDALRTRGFDVWYDRSDMQSGRQLSDEIQREMSARSVFIVMLTPASVDSFWVALETSAYRALMSHDRTRLMLPVQIKKCDIPVLLRGTKWIDTVDIPFDQAVDLIANALSLMPVRSSALPVRRRFSRRTLIGGSVGLVALATVGGIGLRRILTSTPTHPFTARSVLYTLDGDSETLYAVNVADGSIRWKLATNGEYRQSPPAVIGSTVYQGTSDGQFYALDGNSGNVRWHREFAGATVKSVMAPGDGAVYVNTGPLTVYDSAPNVTYALDAASGTVRWQAENTAAFLVQEAVYAWEVASVPGHTVGDPVGITSLASATGLPQWTFQPQPPLGADTHLQAPSLAGGMLLCVGTWDDTAEGAVGQVFAIDAQTGGLLWRHDTQGEITYPVANGQTVFVSTQSTNRSVSALNAKDGSVRWRFPITPRIPDDLGDPTELLVADGVVYFSSDGVYELDATDGTLIAHYLTGEGVDSVPVLSGQVVYVSASGAEQSSFAVHEYASVFAIARQGAARTPLWRIKLPSGSVGQIALNGRAAYVASSGDGIYVVNLADGSIRWKFQAGKSLFTDPAFGP
jgi:outer membrane protein assembly factor BamB